MSQAPTIAVVGATGLVGRQIIASLQLHDVEPDQVRLFASERSEGEELDYEEETLPVERVVAGSFRGVKAAILAVPPEAARDLAAQAQQEGAWVVDVSGAFRVESGVPLVAPGVNDGVVDRPFTGHVVELAHPATQALTAALEPLRAKFGLTFADVTVLAGAALKGQPGVERLSRQTADLMNAKEPDVDTFPHRLAFNVIPGVGDFESGMSQLERQVLVEVARVWAGEHLPALTATALFVPTYHGLVLVVSAHLSRPVDADGVREALKADSNLKVLDEPGTHVYPMPMLTTDDAAVHIGRVRAQGQRVQLVVAVDNAFRLADTAVDLALELAAR